VRVPRHGHSTNKQSGLDYYGVLPVNPLSAAGFPACYPRAMESTEEDPVSFRSALLAWYSKNRRDLPWRGTRDPWAIWVSEVMLQQTRVESVRPRYSAFLAAFPTPAALAAAPEEAVLAHWSGLGYYARARRLRQGASVVADRLGGAFPRDPAAAQGLPGVGPYTAAAILSISFDLPVAVVDGNVARVLARLRRLKPPHDRPGSRTRMLAQALLDPAHAGDHNQAMMELGALVCLPARPLCERCPVARHCQARAARATHLHPAPRARLPSEEVLARLFLLRDRRGRLLLERGRWPLLPHLWLPVIRAGDIGEVGALPPRLRLRAGSLRDAGRLEHTITRHRIRMQVYAGLVDPGPGRPPTGFKLATETELAGLGRSSILDKALRLEPAAARRK
jgi:A/G-specific adenine glycosylase